MVQGRSLLASFEEFLPIDLRMRAFGGGDYLAGRFELNDLAALKRSDDVRRKAVEFNAKGHIAIVAEPPTPRRSCAAR